MSKFLVDLIENGDEFGEFVDFHTKVEDEIAIGSIVSVDDQEGVLEATHGDGFADGNGDAFLFDGKLLGIVFVDVQVGNDDTAILHVTLAIDLVGIIGEFDTLIAEFCENALRGLDVRIAVGIGGFLEVIGFEATGNVVGLLVLEERVAKYLLAHVGPIVL